MVLTGTTIARLRGIMGAGFTRIKGLQTRGPQTEQSQTQAVDQEDFDGVVCEAAVAPEGDSLDKTDARIDSGFEDPNGVLRASIPLVGDVPFISPLADVHNDSHLRPAAALVSGLTPRRSVEAEPRAHSSKSDTVIIKIVAKQQRRNAINRQIPNSCWRLGLRIVSPKAKS